MNRRRFLEASALAAASVAAPVVVGGCATAGASASSSALSSAKAPGANAANDAGGPSPSGSSAAAGSSAAPTGATPLAAPTDFAAYRRLDALALAELVRRGAVGPTALLELAIARAEAVDPRLTTIVVRHFDLARAAAARALPAGPFKGVPFLLKDLATPMAGTITTEGSRFFRDAVNEYDSTLVERFRAAGLVVFGKTHSPEFGGSPSSESALHGATRNPWDPTRSAGGSSGGSAAAVAAGIVPLAHATDGGGSIRIPASACGLFGLKPSRGRVPMGPKVYEGWGGMSAANCVSRSVRDGAALLDAVQGPAIGDAYAAPPRERPFLEEVGRAPGRLRIAWMKQPVLPVPVDAACQEAVAKAAALCASLGHEVEEAAPVVDVASVYRGFSLLASVGTASKVAQREAALGRKVRRDELEPITWISVETGRKASGLDYARARDAIHGASRVLGAFMQRFDLILSPTMACLPPKLGALSLSQPVERFTPVASAASAFTSLFNITGQPAMTVPLHWTAPDATAPQGLPVGVMFAARFGDEATLFRLAGQLEQAAPWFERVAPI